MGNRILIRFLSILIFSVFFFFGNVLAESKALEPGAFFPDLILKNNLTEKAKSYLGVSKKTTFPFKEIPGSLFVIEVTNSYCVSCNKNIPILNKIYSLTEKDPKLKGKVKILSLAAGNNRTEVDNFKKEYKILYPVFIDPNFSSHKALGSPRVPYSIFVMKDAKGKNIVVSVHQGVIDSAESILQEIRDFLACSPSSSSYEFKLK